jgi:hypothetical protein
MRKILSAIAITVIILLVFKYCGEQEDSQIVFQEQSLLIQEQLKNVGKLVVTEGHFSEVFNYKNSKEIFGAYFTSEKKALVVVNADVSVAYDLSKIVYEIDEMNKLVKIISIPEAEIKINPDFEYYDIQADYLNPFKAEDYNAIKESVKTSLQKKIDASTLKSNAKNRLISELSKFYILTNSLGWTLQYKETTISNADEFQMINF